MNKIVELVINFEEFEMDDLGVEIMSLVDAPAIEVGWLAFSEEKFVMPIPGESKDDFISRCIPVVIGEGKDQDQAAAICYSYWDEGLTAFEKHVIDVAKEVGEVVDAEDIIYVDMSKAEFATVDEVLQGIRALDLLDSLTDEARNQQAQIRYRYAGPSGQRTFCATLKALNKVYSREDIARMNYFNPGFGPNGSASYSVFDYKGGPNCRHYWEELVQYQQDGRNVLVSLGPARGDAGMSNNRNAQSPEGSVTNNAYLMSKAWSFSDDDKMIITGPAMIPRQLIARRDEMGNLFHVYFSEETIEKIAKKFLAENKTHNTDINHDGLVVNDNTLLESWIVENPQKDKAAALGFNVPKSTWMVSYKINDKKTWEKIKAGELNGFSVTGNFLEKLQKNG